MRSLRRTVRAPARALSLRDLDLLLDDLFLSPHNFSTRVDDLLTVYPVLRSAPSAGTFDISLSQWACFFRLIYQLDRLSYWRQRFLLCMLFKRRKPFRCDSVLQAEMCRDACWTLKHLFELVRFAAGRRMSDFVHVHMLLHERKLHCLMTSRCAI